MDEHEELDMGDFEVVDECVGEDDDDHDDVRSFGSEDEHEEHYYSDHNDDRENLRETDEVNIDDNSGDNGENILDVSIDVSENEFLENVAKDFSENIEEEVDKRPLRSRMTLRSNKQPTVQLKKLDKEPEPEPTFKKKPGPKSKTMNVPATTPVKKPIQKIVFDKSDEKNTDKKEETKKTTPSASPQKPNTTPQKETKKEPEKSKPTATPNKPTLQKKTPAFLKKDLTDEEIMEHFDEIENSVVTSENFVIQNDIDEEEKEKEKANNENTTEKNKATEDSSQNNEKEKPTEDVIPEISNEEDWDKDCDKIKIRYPKIKIEEEDLNEDQMWYKEKIKAKENIVEDKFTKLARIIQFSYPLYKKWLDKNESLFGTAICKVEASKHIPLDQLSPNRWKFVCSKKNNQQSSKEEDKQADNESDNKNAQQSWQIIPGVPDANVENTEDYPPFVMRVVKVFEEFLQSLDQTLVDGLDNTKDKNDGKDDNKEDSKNDGKDESKQDNKDDGQNDVEILEVSTEDTSTTNEKSESSNKDKENKSDKSSTEKLEGLSLMLRCNRKQELMMHITGKDIKPEFMDKIKEFFENGAGKDCNVKSLYCKNIIKDKNVIKTNTTFLLGSEILEDEVGPIKIQLAPKNNAWTNLAGIELLAEVITEFLIPTKKTSVIDIGCGTGVISLLLSSKCQKIIGLDVQKEIVEAELACDLNGIKNATFVTGKPKVVMHQIDKALSESKIVAVVNTNNVFGRSSDVMFALRKMSNLARIVVITNLSKQAIRSILDLVQPASAEFGNPFIPIRACIVDTSPKQYGFEIVMTMERRTMRNLLKISPVEDTVEDTQTVGLISKSKQMAAAALKINPFAKAGLKNLKGAYASGKKFFPNTGFQGKFAGKRSFAGSDPPYSQGKKFKPFEKPWTGSNVRPTPAFDKRSRDEGDLRDRLSSNREAVVQDPAEQKKLMDALGKLSGVDSETVKKLQDMLNIAIEKTNKLQSQPSRSSVWDRIAPSEPAPQDNSVKPGGPMKGRLVKETGPKEIIITTSNNREPSPPPKSKKYHNVPPLEPDRPPPPPKPERLKMTPSISQKPSSAPYHKPGPNRFGGSNYRKDPEPEPWNRNKSSHASNDSYDKYRPVSPRRFSPPRQRSPPPRQLSPPRRPASPVRRASPIRRASPPRRSSPPRRAVSPPRRPVSPGYRQQHSSSSRNTSTRNNSPPRRPVSPRKKSPKRYADEWDIPSRTAIDNWSRQEKEKQSRVDPWQQGPSSSTSGWNQGGNSNNRFRQESDTWDNPRVSTWDNKNPLPPLQNNSGGGWKGSGMPNNSMGGTNWDVRKEDSMRDMGRHDMRPEPRHDSRQDSRHDSRHDNRGWDWGPEKSFRNDKDDWDGLPEDARDPWGDDHPSSSQQKDHRWNNPSNQPTQAITWTRDKASNDNWSNKPAYPTSNLGGGMSSSHGMNQNMPNSNMNMNIGNLNQKAWQQQSQIQPPNRNQNWMPNNNWQGGGGIGGPQSNIGGMGNLPLLGNQPNNWQQPQQNYSNFNARQQPFNNPFMNNRR